MSESFDLHWRGPAFEGDDRHLLFCGALAVGALFEGVIPRAGDGRRNVRWRCWVTKNMNPVDGVAGSLDGAKRAVEARVREALALMSMRAS